MPPKPAPQAATVAAVDRWLIAAWERELAAILIDIARRPVPSPLRTEFSAEQALPRADDC